MSRQEAITYGGRGKNQPEVRAMVDLCRIWHLDCEGKLPLAHDREHYQARVFVDHSARLGFEPPDRQTKSNVRLDQSIG